MLVPAATAASMSKPFVDLWNKIVNRGPDWLVALIVIVIAYLLAKLIGRLVQKTVGRTSTRCRQIRARGIQSVISSSRCA